MHENRFNREIERLRDPERIARLEVDRVVELALHGLINPRSVLDVGTGSGLFAEKFAVKGLSVTGLDANPEMLTVAQRFVPKGIFQEGTAENLPLPETSFDLVFMGLLLHETDDVLAAVQEAYRVTRRRVAVLEWPDEEQEFGPPRDIRLTHKMMQSLARQAGFKRVTAHRLKSLVLYILDR